MNPVAPERAPVPAPAAERWLDVDGIRTRYLHCPGAAGTPILLIHGLLGYSFSWRFNLGPLAQLADVYALDLPGVGFSERPKLMDRSMRGLARHVLHFMAALGLARADVFGTSHGGAVAMMLAAQAPARVRRLVLVAPVNPWSDHGRLLTRVLATAAGGLMFRCCWPVVRKLHGHEILARMYGDPRRIPPGTVEGYAPPLAIPGTLEHLLAIVRCWHADLAAVEQALPAIASLPVLFVWGSRDTAVLPASAPLLRRQFSRAELAVMDGAGHLPYEEFPGEFNRLAVEYLSAAQ